MPDSAQATVPDVRGAVDRFKRWRPAAQEQALAAVRAAELADWHPFYCTNTRCNGQPHVWPADERECPKPFGHEWHLIEDTWACADPLGQDDEHFCGVVGTLLDDWDFGHARTDQRPPPWKKDWLTLFMRGGRGSGKTRTGSEITNRVTNLVPRITLIGPTGPDFRNLMIEGESGILATSPPGKRPQWEPSKKRLTWPNGCIAEGYSAEEPDRLRGQNSSFIWADEPAHWDLVRQCWDNMLFGLRKGDYPKILASSTPKPTEWVKEQLKDDFTIDRVVPTYANMSNLSPVFRRIIIDRFEGTRLGKQELYGEILDDVEGSMWKWEMLRYTKTEDVPELTRIVVGIDPAGTANKRSDETGLIIVGIGIDKNFYVLADHTGKYSPEGWGSLANQQYVEYRADAIVPEVNFGEDMVTFVLENTINNKDLMPRIIGARSRRGKSIRAEPIVALYEKGRVFHVGDDRGSLEKLDDELCTWVPGEGASPNRVDALVHAMTEIGKVALPAAFAFPGELKGQAALPLRGRPPFGRTYP
jgi:phage terminase large subunit-like protein